MNSTLRVKMVISHHSGRMFGDLNMTGNLLLRLREPVMTFTEHTAQNPTGKLSYTQVKGQGRNNGGFHKD